MKRSIRVFTVSVMLVAIAGLAPGATPKKKTTARVTNKGIPRYTLTYSLSQRGARSEFMGRILDLQTPMIVAEPMFSFTNNLRTQGARGDLQWTLDVATQPAGRGTAVLRVLFNGRELQKTTYRLVAKEYAPPHDLRFDGDPINLSFTNANLREVIGAFGKLASLQVVIDPDVKGTVNMSFENAPWDEALDRVITDSGYHYSREGKKLHVSK